MPMNDPQELEKLRERVEKLESRMEFLFRRMGISQPIEPQGADHHSAEQARPEPPKWKPSPTVLALVHKGDRTAAMKQFMSETGASLKDAKEFIERL